MTNKHTRAQHQALSSESRQSRRTFMCEFPRVDVGVLLDNDDDNAQEPGTRVNLLLMAAGQKRVLINGGLAAADTFALRASNPFKLTRAHPSIPRSFDDARSRFFLSPFSSLISLPFFAVTRKHLVNILGKKRERERDRERAKPIIPLTSRLRARNFWSSD